MTKKIATIIKPYVDAIKKMAFCPRCIPFWINGKKEICMKEAI